MMSGIFETLNSSKLIKTDDLFESVPIRLQTFIVNVDRDLNIFVGSSSVKDAVNPKATQTQ